MTQKLHELFLAYFLQNQHPSAMLWYAQYFGDWHDYWCNYSWQKLPGGGEHRALSDCKATFNLIKGMAACDYSRLQTPTPFKLFPPVQVIVEWEDFIRIKYKIGRGSWGWWKNIPVLKLPFLKVIVQPKGELTIRKESFSFSKLFKLINNPSIADNLNTFYDNTVFEEELPW